MKDYEDEEFDRIDREQAMGWRKRQIEDKISKDDALKLAQEAFEQYMPYQLNEKERVALAAIKKVLPNG